MPTDLRRKDVKLLVQQRRAQLIEVLPPEEYKREHLPGAVNLPLSDLTTDSVRQLKKDQAVIVYCTDSASDLSGRAAWRLESMGFQEVYRYTLGKADWISAGFETEGTEAKKPRIKQMMKRNVMTCTPKEKLGAVKNRRPDPNDICIVLNDRNIVLGAIYGDAWNGIRSKMRPRSWIPHRRRSARAGILQRRSETCASRTFNI